MKKTFALLSLVMMLALSGCSQLAGDPTSKTFSLKYYTKINVDGAFHVTVSNAANQVIVVAGEKVLSKVVVEVVDETLKIYLKGFEVGSWLSDLEVVVPYNASMSDVALSGAARFQSDFPISSRKVGISLSGASKCYCEVEAKELSVDLSGASEAALKGKSTSIAAHLSGASSISDRKDENRYALSCNTFTGTISGASTAHIHCDGTIKADLSGASKLHYSGKATTKGSSTSGNSHIIHHD